MFEIRAGIETGNEEFDRDDQDVALAMEYCPAPLFYRSLRKAG